MLQLSKDNDYACFIWYFRDLILYSSPGSMIRLMKYDRSELYRKKQQVRNWFLRTCKDRICQLAPSKKNLFKIKFETDSYFLNSMKKILFTWANKVTQHSGSSF